MATTPQAPAVKTYVLIGHDQKDADAIYSQHDVTILRPKLGQSMQDLIQEANIQPPANVILQAHSDRPGHFQWNENEGVNYKDLFSALPRSGILSVTLGSCFAGSVVKETMLEALPPGTILQTMTGRQTENLSSASLKFAAETEGLTNPTDLYLKALDNFNPQQFKDFFEARNKNYHYQAYADPNKALPEIMGLGGSQALVFNLNDEMDKLSQKVDKVALEKAIQRVQTRFDTARGYARDGNVFKLDLEKINNGLGAEAETAVDGQIRTVAKQLMRGEKPDGKTVESVENKRIALAITAAYLDESGLLSQAIDEQKGFAMLNAKGESIVEAAVEKQQRGNLTRTEQAYIASVKDVLDDKPELKKQLDGIIGELKTAFKQSNGNDGLDSALAQKLSGAGISTKGWER